MSQDTARRGFFHDSGDALDRIGRTRSTYFILALTMLGGLFDAVEQSSIGIVGPTLQKSWHLSASAVGWLSTTTLIAMVAGGFLAGVIGDKYGRRITFTFNLAIYSLGSLICAFAANYLILTVGRAVVGIGLGGEISISLTLLAELVPTRFRGAGVSMFNVGTAGIGFPVAYGLGLLILEVFGPTFGGSETSWRWFFGLLAIPALLVLWARRNLPETPRFLANHGRVHEANLTLSSLAAGKMRPDDRTVITEYLDESTFHGDAADTAKIQFLDVFRGRLLKHTLTVGIAAWMSFGAQLAVLTLMPIVLVSRGYNIMDSLTFSMIGYVGGFLGAVAAALLNLRVPHRAVMIPGGVLGCIFGLLFGLGSGTASILVFGFCFYFFVYLLNTTIYSWAPELYPTRIRSFGSALISNIGLGAGAVMTVVASAIFESSGSNGMFVMLAVMYLGISVACIFAPETRGVDLEEFHSERA